MSRERNNPKLIVHDEVNRYLPNVTFSECAVNLPAGMQP